MFKYVIESLEDKWQDDIVERLPSGEGLGPEWKIVFDWPKIRCSNTYPVEVVKSLPVPEDLTVNFTVVFDFEKPKNMKILWDDNFSAKKARAYDLRPRIRGIFERHLKDFSEKWIAVYGS